MALGTEAPSTGSQREPSRLEENTNQRLTGHSHSPHQRGSPTPAQLTLPAPHFTSRCWGWIDGWMDEHLAATQEKFGWHVWNKRTMFIPVCMCHLCRCTMGNRLQTWSGFQPMGLECDCHVTSALRSSSRVQNTNTKCPHNTGLLSDRKGRYKKRRPGGSYIIL